MRVRTGFVSNSSSTAFIITNKTKGVLSLVDFVRENPQLIEEFVKEYDWHKPEDGYNQEALLRSAEVDVSDHDRRLAPGDNYRIFGDESQTRIGEVFDYILRDGGESKSFAWRFEEYLR